jgi:alpha-tubulin suppressor-like RCC1 family protein
MRFVPFLLGSALLVPAPVEGMQSRVVTGIVTDTAGKPVADAQVVAANQIVDTGRDGRFRLSIPDAPTCSFSVVSRSGSARIRFETCPDTALRIVVRRTSRSENSFGPRCGTRSNEPCTDRDGLRFITVSSGQVHSCGISVDSAAYCWGDGRNGQLGNGKREIFRFPQRVLGTNTFATIHTGGAFTCAQSTSGDVFCWGSERTVPGWPHQPEGPVRVMLDEPAASLAVGRRHACVLNGEGRASCWGWNVDGETGIGSSGINQSMVPRPTPVMTEDRFVTLSAGLGFTCGVTTMGQVRCWGSNVDFVLGATAPEQCGDVGWVPCSSRPVAVELPERITSVSSGAGHVCALSDREVVYCWGANGAGQSGVFRTNAPFLREPVAVTLPFQGRLVALSSGGINTCVLTSTQAAYCWGSDNVNHGDDIERTALIGPRPVPGGTRFRTVSIGQVHGCGLDTGGRLHCWGDTILGALGIR